MFESSKWNGRKKRIIWKVGFLLQEMMYYIIVFKLGNFAPHWTFGND